jgi:ATP-binding cassette subfamily B protein
MSKTKPVQLNSKTALLKRLFYFVRPYKKKFFFSVFLSVFLAAMAPLRPFLIQLTINEGIAGKSTFFLSGPGAFILEVTLFQIILLLIETSARFYFTFSTASLGQHVVKDLRDATYSKILRLNLSQFDKTPIGTLTTRTVNDIESVNDIFSDGLIPILADFLSILSVLSYMFYTDWQITLICLIPFPILILATYFFKESVNKSFVKVRNAVASLNAFIQEHLSGMSVIQAFAAEKREMNKFKKINNEHRNANIKAIFAYSVFFPIVELVSALSIGLLVWWTAHQSFSMPFEESKNIAGVITSFILCINLLFRPLRMIADKFNVLQMGMIASERVFKVLDNEDVLIESEIHNQHFEENHILNGNINFSDVWFAYDEKNFVLKGINFEVESGKTLAIVGNTGSGKTTIVSLINRLYHIQKGLIKIGGTDVEDFKIDELRSKIAVVLQDVFLFSGSVLDNMTLRNPEISKVMAIEAAKNIGLHDFIMQLPENYDFNVMERGATLSTGQRQLLSFARALLYKPYILILDEATSSIDAESELLIQNAIDKVIKGRTSIIIAHRLSTIKKADKIIVLERGEIKEMGSHTELIDKKGHYFELYQKQFSSDLV